MSGNAMKEPLLGGDALSSPSSSSVTLLGNTDAAIEKTALEPQNALTRKFTQEEWVALTKFRVRSISVKGDAGLAPNTLTIDSAARGLR